MRFETSDIRQSDWQCGLWRMPLIYGGLLGGVGFLDCARNDGGFAKQSDSQIKESTIKFFLLIMWKIVQIEFHSIG